MRNSATSSLIFFRTEEKVSYGDFIYYLTYDLASIVYNNSLNQDKESFLDDWFDDWELVIKNINDDIEQELYLFCVE